MSNQIFSIMKKIKFNWCVLIFIIGIIGNQSWALAKNNIVGSSTEICFDGTWKEEEGEPRSLPIALPITAETDCSYSVFIYNQSPRHTIGITILDSYGGIVYSYEVSAQESAYIVIPIDGLSEGEYTLELRNPSGGYLYGSFVKLSKKRD